MAKCMSFGDEFYQGEFSTYDSVPKSERPTSLIQALYSMADDDWEFLCRETGHNPETVDAWEMMADLYDSLSCRDYSSPIEVYLSDSVSVLVHEARAPHSSN